MPRPWPASSGLVEMRARASAFCRPMRSRPSGTRCPALRWPSRRAIALQLLLITSQRRGDERTPNGRTSTWTTAWTIPVPTAQVRVTPDGPGPSRTSNHSPLSPWTCCVSSRPSRVTAPSFCRRASMRRRIDRTRIGRYREPCGRTRRNSGLSTSRRMMRRTAASFMTKLRIPRLHVEKVLNHSTGDIAEVYDRHDYLPEKRTALEKWGEHLSALTNGQGRIVSLITAPCQFPTRFIIGFGFHVLRPAKLSLSDERSARRRSAWSISPHTP